MSKKIKATFVDIDIDGLVEDIMSQIRDKGWLCHDEGDRGGYYIHAKRSGEHDFNVKIDLSEHASIDVEDIDEDEWEDIVSEY